jgi:hypothetical protein
MQGADSLYVGQSSGSENRATGRFGFSAVGDFDMDFDEEDFQRDNPESGDVDSYLMSLSITNRQEVSETRIFQDANSISTQ